MEASLLQALPNSFGNLRSLSHLRLFHFPVLENLSATFGLLTRLEYLDIYSCALGRLPDNFGNLSALAHLELEECSGLEELPANFGMLSSLNQFRLTGCSMLHTLPESMGQLKALTELTICGASLLQALPESLGNLRSLTHLGLIDFPLLEELPANFELLSMSKSESSGASKPKDLKSALHEGITCDGCDMSPIKGSRYVSITEDNFDLCFSCFEMADNQAKYFCIKQSPEPETLTVEIVRCSFLNPSVLLSFGWVPVKREFHTGGVKYRRAWLDEDSFVH